MFDYITLNQNISGLVIFSFWFLEFDSQEGNYQVHTLALLMTFRINIKTFVNIIDQLNFRSLKCSSPEFSIHYKMKTVSDRVWIRVNSIFSDMYGQCFLPTEISSAA